jgi:hypothetical protein
MAVALVHRDIGDPFGPGDVGQLFPRQQPQEQRPLTAAQRRHLPQQPSPEYGIGLPGLPYPGCHESFDGWKVRKSLYSFGRPN